MIALAMREAAGLQFVPSPKIALQLADRIEWRLAGNVWTEGYSLGSEDLLAEQYCVTKSIARQAVRVLESRDLGHVRRGRAGGFVVHRPAWSTLGRLMAMHLTALSVDTEDISNAYCLLRGAIPIDAPDAIRVAEALVLPLYHEINPDAGNPSSQKNRAMEISRRMLRDFAPTRKNLNTIEFLMDYYSAGRPTVIQAIRVLEQLEILGTSRGPSGGLRWQNPSPSAIVKALCPHFRAHDLDLTAANRVVWTINGLAASTAADRGDDGRLSALRRRLVAERETGAHRWLQVAVFKALSDIAQNPALHVLARSLWFYRELNISSSDTAIGVLSHAELDSTISLLDEVIAGNRRSAFKAVADCFEMAI